MFINQGTFQELVSELCDIIHYKNNLNVIYYNRKKWINILYNFIKKLFGGWAYFNTEDGLKKIIDLKRTDYYYSKWKSDYYW